MILHAAALLWNIVQHKKKCMLIQLFLHLSEKEKKNKQYWLHLDLVMCFMEHTLWLCEPLCFWVLNCSTINLVLDIFYFKSKDFRLVIGINHFFCLVFSYFSDFFFFVYFLPIFIFSLILNIKVFVFTHVIHYFLHLNHIFEGFFFVFMQKQKIKINHLQRN